MELITLIVIAFLCLLSKKTRKFAYVLLVLLLLAYPFTFIAVLAIALVIHFINKSNQRKLYEPPTLPRSH
jgi:hypothetical protein